MPLGFYPIPAGARLPEGGAEEVGNKSWNLMRMAASGLPVPPESCCRPAGAGRAAGMASTRSRCRPRSPRASAPWKWPPIWVLARHGDRCLCPCARARRIHARNAGDRTERRPEHADSGRLDSPHRQSATGLGQLSPPRSGLCRSGGSAACSLVRCSGERDRR